MAKKNFKESPTMISNTRTFSKAGHQSKGEKAEKEEFTREEGAVAVMKELLDKVVPEGGQEEACVSKQAVPTKEESDAELKGDKEQGDGKPTGSVGRCDTAVCKDVDTLEQAEDEEFSVNAEEKSAMNQLGSDVREGGDHVVKSTSLDREDSLPGKSAGYAAAEAKRGDNGKIAETDTKMKVQAVLNENKHEDDDEDSNTDANAEKNAKKSENRLRNEGTHVQEEILQPFVRGLTREKAFTVFTFVCFVTGEVVRAVCPGVTRLWTRRWKSMPDLNSFSFDSLVAGDAKAGNVKLFDGNEVGLLRRWKTLQSLTSACHERTPPTRRAESEPKLNGSTKNCIDFKDDNLNIRKTRSMPCFLYVAPESLERGRAVPRRATDNQAANIESSAERSRNIVESVIINDLPLCALDCTVDSKKFALQKVLVDRTGAPGKIPEDYSESKETSVPLEQTGNALPVVNRQPCGENATSQSSGEPQPCVLLDQLSLKVESEHVEAISVGLSSAEQRQPISISTKDDTANPGFDFSKRRVFVYEIPKYYIDETTYVSPSKSEPRCTLCEEAARKAKAAKKNKRRRFSLFSKKQRTARLQPSTPSGQDATETKTSKLKRWIVYPLLRCFRVDTC